VTRAMAKEPADRFASADEMRAALTNASTTVIAPPALAAVATSPPLPPTMAMTPPTVAGAVEPMAAGPPGRSSRASRAWWLALFVLAAIAAGAVAIAAGDDADGDRIGPSTQPGTAVTTATRQGGGVPATQPPATEPVETPAPTEPPPTEPPPTEPPPTEPPPTEPPPTEPLPTEPVPTEPPTPTDLDELLGTLGDGTALGESGPELVDDLGEVLDRDGADQAEQARKLLDDIEKWDEDGELGPGVADLARSILEPIAAQAGGDGDGDGDGEEEEDD